MVKILEEQIIIKIAFLVHPRNATLDQHQTSIG